MSEENNELPIECQSFDDEFATLIDYARMYRSLGFQVVPAMSPSSGKNWKRPALPSWKEFTNKLATEEQFNSWFSGHNNLTNIGLLTGPCSNNLFIIDLDIHKNPTAMIWWEGIHADNNGGVMLEPPTQRTGGGGLQMLFIAPDGWTPPTIKTSIGVDIRGVGGFAVVAPSKHEKKGSEYSWLPGQEPYTIPTPVATTWLCQEVSDLAAKFGGHVTTASGERIRTETPVHQTDQWGHLTDGREDRMYRMVFRTILDLYRDCPFIDSKTESEAKITCFNTYVDLVETRIKEIGTPKHVLLEREGRGKSLFDQKWRHAMRQWDTKISEEAQKPWDGKTEEKFAPSFQASQEKKEEPEPEDSSFPERPSDLLRVWDIEDLKNLPPPNWIWEDIIVEGGSHFFAAAPGVGKTFIGMGLCIAIATGMKSFLGRKVNKHGMVIYITTEGLYDHYNRVQAFEEEYGVKLNRENYIVIPDALNLLKDADKIRLLKTIDWEVTHRGKGEPPAIVVYDTISKVIPGADENAQQDTSLFLKIKTEIKQMFNTTDLGMHHVARHGEGGMRGSTTFEGDADGIYVMEREKGADELIFKAFKNKAAPDGWEMVINMKTVSVNGFSTSLVPTIRSSNNEPVHDFGGKQETGMIYAAGVKMTIEERDEILRGANEAWNNNDPWSMSRNTINTRRHVSRGLKRVLKKRIRNESHAVLVATAFIDMELWEEQIKDSHSKLKGIKVLKIPQNSAEALRKSCGDGAEYLRTNDEQNQ